MYPELGEPRYILVTLIVVHAWILIVRRFVDGPTKIFLLDDSLDRSARWFTRQHIFHSLQKESKAPFEYFYKYKSVFVKIGKNWKEICIIDDKRVTKLS